MPTAPKLSRDLTQAVWKSIKPKSSPVPAALAAVEARYAAIKWELFPVNVTSWKYEDVKNYQAYLGRQIREQYEPLKKQLDTLRNCANRDAAEYKLGSGKADKKDAAKIKQAADAFESAFGAYFSALSTEYKSTLAELETAITAYTKAGDTRVDTELFYEKILAKIKTEINKFEAYGDKVDEKQVKAFKEAKASLEGLMKKHNDALSAIPGVRGSFSPSVSKWSHAIPSAIKERWDIFDRQMALNKKISVQLEKMKVMAKMTKIKVQESGLSEKELEKLVDSLTVAGKKLGDAKFSVEQGIGNLTIKKLDNLFAARGARTVLAQIKYQKANIENGRIALAYAEKAIKGCQVNKTIQSALVFNIAIKNQLSNLMDDADEVSGLIKQAETTLGKCVAWLREKSTK